MKRKNKVGERNFSQISLQINLVREFQAMHKELAPKFSASGFFQDMIELYRAQFCPECGMKLIFKSCSCKDTEKL